MKTDWGFEIDRFVKLLLIGVSLTASFAEIVNYFHLVKPPIN